MLRMEKITKVFSAGTGNEKVVFSDFSLDVPTGQFVSVIGSNGSGKTTLLNLLSGAVTADQGVIVMDGVDLTRLPSHRRYQRMGRVFQDPAAGTAPQMTLRENLSMAANKNRPWNLRRAALDPIPDEVMDALARVGLGLEEKLEEPVSHFSGGQRQAVALLMATLPPIDYLLLDEHTAALDPKTAERIMEMTDHLVKEKNLTTLMVTHNLRYALQYGDRLLMMHEGKAIVDAEGKTKEALSMDQVLDTFYEISIEVGNSI